jgi:uncharacterized Ntn-hydrolase superfamily protein
MRRSRAGTYSIVARDMATGDLGVAVQSHWFSVGSLVTWARPGIGAVATQSIVEPAYGPRLLERLGAGEEPAAALAEELASDPLAHFRQVAVVDGQGRLGVHTGDGCIAAAGDTQGDGFSAQANMMSSAAVWPAMASAFVAAEGTLDRRLLAALDAAEAAGGDVRGRQSAALLVVPAEGDPWRATAELRVEDSPDPLAELRRLLDLKDAYALADRADTLAGEGRATEAAALYAGAAAAAPGSAELAFWAGLGIAASGDLDGGTARVREAIESSPGLGELLSRLEPEIAPSAADVRERLRD